MDFSSVLSKQLEQKRHDKEQRENVANRMLNSDKLPSLGEKVVSEVMKNESNEHNLSENGEENRLLHSTDQDKLAESLIFFNENEESQLKEEQLRKLQIHVRQEKKDLRYKAYLDEENGVAVQIQLADIAALNRDKLCLQIRRFFKEILQTWASSAAGEFPESILVETKRDIVKLMYKLRSGKLPADSVVSLSTIVYYIQTENIVKANESYLKLSIGNVAWPIGVRDVGIHARAADAKIAGDDKKQLANIMKSEATRRWLIAVKRIVNYCEKLHARK